MRPKLRENSTTATLTFEDEVWRRFRAQCMMRKQSPSILLQQAIEAILAQWKKEGDKR